MKALASFIAGAACGWFASGLVADRSAGEAPAPVRTDTVTVRDTVILTLPRERGRLTVRRDTVTVVLPSGGDTLRAPVPVTQVHYADSMAEAWVSGWHPALDSIRVFPRTVTVTRTLPAHGPGRWHIGVTAGATVTAHGVTPGISAGITYSFISF